MRTSTFSPTLCFIRKKPTAQIAHLVFANTQANPKKPKELFFCQCTLNRIEKRE
jgi:hypothetical protein